MSKTVIGRNLPLYKGNYDKSKTYNIYDVVLNNGSSYVSKKKNNIGNALTNTEFWQLLAQKGEKPVNGIDYNTEQEKEEFKQAVVEDSKTDMDNYTETKKTELDTHTNSKKEELDTHKSNLESAMSTTKDNLVQEIETAQNGFDENATLKKIAFNNNVTEQTNTFNSNAETKTADFNTNASTKQTEYDNNATSKLEEYNSNATAKVNEFNENAESYVTELEELAQQMPWNTTDIQESIHIEDSAKYSRNKLNIFGNLTQETRKGYNLLDISVIKTQTSNGVTITNNGDGTLTFNGTATKSFGINTEITQKTIPAGNYTKYIIKDTNIGTGLTVSLGKTTSGSISGTVLQPKNGISSLELTEDLTYNQLRLYINSGAVFNNYVLKWMIVEGTYTENTIPAYEQYGAMPSIDYPSMPVVSTGVQKITKIGKNYISTALEDLQQGTLSGSTGEPSTSTSRVCHNKFFEIDYDNVAQNFTFLIEDGYKVALRVYDRNKKHISLLEFSSFLKYLPQKYIGAGVKYIKLVFAKTDDSNITPNDIKDIKVMIAKGTNQSYEQYKAKETFELDLGTTELCKITDTNGNVVAQDRPVYREVNGIWKWQWEKIIPKIVIDGTTTNRKVNLRQELEAYDKYTIYLKENIFELPEYYGTQSILSNMFKTARSYGSLTSGKDTNNTNTIAIWTYGGTAIVFSTEHGRFASIEEANAYFAKNNLIIYGKGYDTQHIDCAPEQSATLDKLYKLQLQQGTNNIFVESENGVTTELQLTYMQDRIMLEEAKDKSFDDRITALEAMIVSNASEEV